METKNTTTKPVFKIVAAVLLVLGLFIAFSAGRMYPPVFALATLSALGGWGFLLYTMNKDLPNGLPQTVRIVGLFLLGFAVIAGFNETLLGFAVPDYVYWTIPEVEQVSNWVGIVMALIVVLIIGGGVFFRNQLGEWFYD